MDQYVIRAYCSICANYWTRLGLLHTNPIQYEHAPLRVRCAMLHKHPPVDPVLSCLSCFRKSSVGVCQVVSNSRDPGTA